MAGNIFINYRREESGHVAGRLHDSLAPTFGRNKLFMDVDNIPVGRDFEDYLKSQVAACDAMLAVIGPNWLTAKDETGKRRLDNPDDFIVIEIGAALTRKIPVVPVLVDGARMPKASELPEPLKPLAKRQAVEVRHTNFSSDAEALVKRLREALGYDFSGRQWRVRAAKALAALAVLLLVGWAGYKIIHPMRIYLEEAYRAVQQLVEETKAEREAKATTEAEEQRKADEVERQRLEQDRQAQAAAEAEAKRKADEAEQQRLVALKADEQRRRAEAPTAAAPPTNGGAVPLPQTNTATPTPPDPAAVNPEAAPIGDAVLLNELRDRLYELNFDPGVLDGPLTDANRKAIQEFQQQINVPPTGAATLGLLRRLRELNGLKPWASIVFNKDTGKWGMAWDESTRKSAVARARISCGDVTACPVEVSFFGTSCGAFAHSGANWAISARDDIGKARAAALADCGRHTKSCQIVAAVCANGAERFSAK